MKNFAVSCRGISQERKIDLRLAEISSRLNEIMVEVDKLIKEAESLGAEVQPIVELEI